MGIEMTDFGNTPTLTLLGYRQGSVEMAIACIHPAGVVLSIGDLRVELDKDQVISLKNMLEQFLLSKTEL